MASYSVVERLIVALLVVALLQSSALADVKLPYCIGWENEKIDCSDRCIWGRISETGECWDPPPNAPYPPPRNGWRGPPKTCWCCCVDYPDK